MSLLLLDEVVYCPHLDKLDYVKFLFRAPQDPGKSLNEQF